MTIYSIGHSNRPVEVLLSMLAAAGVEVLVDVRSYPSSRYNPQFNAQALSRSLAVAGMAYRHAPALGGRRSPQEESQAQSQVQNQSQPSPNGAWTEPAFHSYADYALTPAFRQGLETLTALADEKVLAIMCAEADWRQCHRRIVTDYLLAAGYEVLHLRSPDKREEARMTAGAVVETDSRVTYPPRQGVLF